ncbi:MAG: MFS transporter [Ignavibacteriae bacterium]|nr:MFS transporter [Ignavibacteriota bacterium]
MKINELFANMRQGFTSTFWVANTLELFERFAFYGSKAVLTVYLATKVGLEKEAGTLAGLFSGVIFSLPIVAGVFVDRYGFKRTLMACFAFFCVGYFLIGLAGLEFGQSLVNVFGKKAYVIGVLLLTAIGGSLIKPCIVGTVAKTSKPDVKSLGFSIYYTLVNVGGAVGPILALQVRENLGIEYVLVMSSLTSLLLFLSAMLFFKEPESSTEGMEARTFGKVFKDMLLVFGNLKFITFLVIFSGFWIMFWQIFYSFPFYVTGVLKFAKFELLETVDAWTIILLSVPVTALFKKWSPIAAMTLGFVIASFSWFLIGISATVAAAVVGIAFFAIGEATQAARFYEYVSSLAPKEQVGTFMGFAFLPVAIGSFAAGPISDWLRTTYLVETANPSMMWYILGGIGIVSTVLMFLYNVIIVKRQVTA